MDTSEHERLKSLLALDMSSGKLLGLREILASGGLGSFVVRQALDFDQVEIMQTEIFDPHCVQWRDNHHDFENERHMWVEQRHDVFALKLSRGDQSHVERVPHMRALAANIQGAVQRLADSFPPLASWEADEMSLHRYDEQEIGLGFHKDNKRFIGLIAVLTLEGSSDFVVLDDDGNEHPMRVEAGDLNFTRASGLYEYRTPDGKIPNLCPDHAVKNLQSAARTSFIVRANAKPQYTVPGFTYDNWVGVPEPRV